MVTSIKVRQLEGLDLDVEEALLAATSPSSANPLLTESESNLSPLRGSTSGSLVTSGSGTTVLASLVWNVSARFLEIKTYHAIPGASDISGEGRFVVDIEAATITGSWVNKNTGGSTNQDYSGTAMSTLSLSAQANISTWNPGTRTITVSATHGAAANTVNLCQIIAF